MLNFVLKNRLKGLAPRDIGPKGHIFTTKFYILTTLADFSPHFYSHDG